MKRTAILNVVGLSESLLGTHTPNLQAFRHKGKLTTIQPAFPAVTCTAQSNYLTGRTPTQHGIVANGWYNRELAEVQFWKQSNHVVQCQKLWHELRSINPSFTCAKMFWWYNMYAAVDYSITPRPMYPADGRKFFDVYTWPSSISADIKKDLGEFPFAGFWGPVAGLDSPQGKADCATRWIADSAKWIEKRHSPTLNLVYLPHLDYNLQRLGPGHQKIQDDLRQIDAIVGDLIVFFEGRGVEVMVLSEYGITAVDTPIHLNRILRDKGWITIREELGLEILDAGNSRAFAVADHQVAHIYVNDSALVGAVRALVEKQNGVSMVLGSAEKKAAGIDHPRAGDLIAVAKDNAWFTYYYWLDDRRAPDFARCVDIHRKPGYDPAELFLDPKLTAAKLKIIWRLLQKKLGFRMLMDVIPLDATLVKGSHGRCPSNRAEFPVLLTGPRSAPAASLIQSTDVFGAIKRQVIGA